MPDSSSRRPQRDGDFIESTRELGRDARKVASDLQDIYSTAADRVNLGRVYRDNPFLVLGIAAGVGYVLGGGLFTPFTARLLKLGARAVVIPMLTSQLERAALPPQSANTRRKEE